MQTLQTPLKFSVQRNGSVTPLIAANHLPVAKRESGRPSSSTTQVEKEEPLTIRSKSSAENYVLSFKPQEPVI